MPNNSVIHAKDTDIARYRSDDPKDVVKNWLRSKSTIEFLGLWEQIINPNFKGVEFDGFRNKSGANAFTMSPCRRFCVTLFPCSDLLHN